MSAFRTLMRLQCRRRNWRLSQVGRLLKTESEFYQFRLGPRASEKLHANRNSERSIFRRRGKAGGHFDGRKTRESSDNAGALFLKGCANGKDQTFLMRIHQGIKIIFRHEIG